MKILALDLSLSNCGWAFNLDHFGVERGPGKHKGAERLAEWRDWLIGLLVLEEPDVVVIEGYAFSKAKQSGVRSTAEWKGVALLSIHDAAVPVVEIPPNVLKKYATFNGNAPKPDMRMALYKRTGLDVSDDNTVDAIWLAAAGYQLAGDPIIAVPKAQVAALDKVEWPNDLWAVVEE